MPDPLAAPDVLDPTKDVNINAPTDWRAGIADDDLRSNAALANFKEIDSLAKSYVELKSYQGNSLHIPGEDTNEEQRAEFANKLVDKVPGVMLRPDMENPEQSKEFYLSAGMPKESTGYEAPEVEVPEGVTVDKDRGEFFKEVAHEAGLTKAQYKKVMEAVTKADIESAVSTNDSHNEAVAALNKEWGSATDERRQAALNIAEKTGAPEYLIEGLKTGNIPPEMVKWAYSLSVAIGGEGTNLISNQQSKSGRLTPDEAQEKINEIYANKDHPFHHGDTKAMERMVKLVSAVDPSASTDVNDLRTGTSFSA